MDAPKTLQTEGHSVDISVVIPVLNEQDSIVSLSDKIVAVLVATERQFEVVFVDDGSSDATAARVKEIHQRDSRIKLVRLRRNFGKAAALSAGFDHAQGGILITMDGDLQDDPEEIPRFLEALEQGGYDLVSGWKRNRQDPAGKRYPSRLFNWVTRRMARVELHDFNCGFKAYRREVADEVAIYGELHRYIPVLASRRGFAVGEIEVRHHPRRHGSSKYGWDRLYKGFLDLLTVLFITRYTRRPLHLFGLVGLMALMMGVGINAYLAWRWFEGEWLSNRPLLLLGVLLMILGIQMVTTGLIAEMISANSFRSTESYSVRETLT